MEAFHFDQEYTNCAIELDDTRLTKTTDDHTSARRYFYYAREKDSQKKGERERERQRRRRRKIEWKGDETRFDHSSIVIASYAPSLSLSLSIYFQIEFDLCEPSNSIIVSSNQSMRSIQLCVLNLHFIRNTTNCVYSFRLLPFVCVPYMYSTCMFWTHLNCTSPVEPSATIASKHLTHRGWMRAPTLYEFQSSTFSASECIVNRRVTWFDPFTKS